jgi:8-amino-7-oxononanoate synthase
MNHSPIYNRIEKLLDTKKEQHLFRTLAQPQLSTFIDMSTNSYLGLHENKDVAQAACKLAGTQLSGNCASRLVASLSPLFGELENELASWKNTESALLFNSGYAANTGMIQALCTRSTAVFSDKLNHASIIDGIRLSGASMIRYRHGDMSDLKARLAATDAAEKLIVTDTVFSMDGDCAPLHDICDLARTFNCMIMVDEAHATGIFGTTGSGLVEEYGLEKHIDIRMGTLSKSVAGLGGYFAGSSILRNFFVNTARSLIFSTALPHSILAHNLAAIQHIRQHPEAGKNVRDMSETFRNALHDMQFDTLASTTHIVPCLCTSEEQAVALSRFLFKNNIIAPAIRPPTVPANTSRIRFSIHGGLTNDTLHHVIDALQQWKLIHG